MGVEHTDKLQELILYIAERMERDDHVGRGRIKLAKLMFNIDFEAFARWGESVTQATYHADQLGPVAVQEPLATRDLEQSGRFAWRLEWDRQKLPVALEHARLDVFDRHERTLIDEMLDRYRLVSASAMVDQAHLFPGWLIAWRDGEGKNEVIPFESIFWNPTRPPGSMTLPWENEHARVLADRYGG